MKEFILVITHLAALSVTTNAQDQLHWRLMKELTDDKPFSCLQCDKRYSTSSALKTHKRTHTGDKPFSCSQCDHKCSTSGDLKKHERIHTGDRPFSCSHCNYKYANPQHQVVWRVTKELTLVKIHSAVRSLTRNFDCLVWRDTKKVTLLQLHHFFKKLRKSLHHHLIKLHYKYPSSLFSDADSKTDVCPSIVNDCLPLKSYNTWTLLHINGT